MSKRVEGRSDRLLECACVEFMEMGYQEASLRVIAAKAGTTTGSIYSRFKDKEGLFHALVDGVIDPMLALFERGHSSFAEKPSGEQQDEVFSYASDYWDVLVDYIYAHWETFRLLARCQGIGCWEDMINRFVETEVKYTYSFLDSTGNDAVRSGRLTPMMAHMLSSAFFSGLFEVVRHDMAKNDAIQYVRQLRRFFVQGWSDLLGMKPE